jgi:hypothetical protein
VNDKNSSSPWVCTKKTERKEKFLLVSNVPKGSSSDLLLLLFSFLQDEERGKNYFGHKILSTETSKRAYCCFYLLFAFCLVLKIEVINHRNHYFMAKCNYEFVRMKLRGRPKVVNTKMHIASRRGKPHFNNII